MAGTYFLVFIYWLKKEKNNILLYIGYGGSLMYAHLHYKKLFNDNEEKEDDKKEIN